MNIGLICVYLQEIEGVYGSDGDASAQGEAVMVGGKTDIKMVVGSIKRRHHHYGSHNLGRVKSPVRKINVDSEPRFFHQFISAAVGKTFIQNIRK